jgi:DNA invertase Pin-like site-specific DNA recombinase
MSATNYSTSVETFGAEAMTDGKWISYLRVSTARQGKSGLGIEAQRHAVAEFLNGGNWTMIKEFVEVETGKRADRPKLAEAIQACRIYGARLVIAKLDRLARNAVFLLGVRDAGIDFVCADMPSANRLTVGIMAMVAEDEAQRISDRTKAALAAAKKRGTVLGGYRGVTPSSKDRAKAVEALQARANAKAADLAPVIAELQAAGRTSLRAIAAGLNEAGIPTARGGEWSSVQVMRLLERLDPFREKEAA